MDLQETRGTSPAFLEAQAGAALQQLLQTFFGGSIGQALSTHLADPRATISVEEAVRLTRLISEARQRGG